MSRRPFTAVAVDEVTPLPDRGGSLRIVLSPRNAGTGAGLMVVAEIDPGEWIREHYHPYSEEMVLLETGRMEVTIDDERHLVEAGTAFMIPRGARHRMTNVGEVRLRAILALGPLAPEPELGHVDTE